MVMGDFTDVVKVHSGHVMIMLMGTKCNLVIHIDCECNSPLMVICIMDTCKELMLYVRGSHESDLSLFGICL